MNYQLIDKVKIPAYIAYDSGNEWTIRCDNFESLNSTHDNNNHICNNDPKTFTNIIDGDAREYLKKFDLVIPKNVEILDQGHMNTHFSGDHTIKENPVGAGQYNDNVQWNQDSWLQTRYERDKLLKNHNNGLIQFIPNEENINNRLNKPKHNLFIGSCPDNKIVNNIITNLKLYNDIGYLKADGPRKYVRYEEIIPTRVKYVTNFTCGPTTSYLENVLSTKEYTGDEFSQEVGTGLKLNGSINSIEYDQSNDKVIIKYYKLKPDYNEKLLPRSAIEIKKKSNYKVLAKNYSGTQSSYEKSISDLSNLGMNINNLAASLSYYNNNELNCTEGYGLSGFKIEGPDNNTYKITPYCLLIDEITEGDGSKKNPSDPPDNPPEDPEDTPWYLSTVAIIVYVVLGIIVVIAIIAVTFSGSGNSPTVIPEGYEVIII